ncbi:MAG: ATP-binding protein [Hyphomicrobiaceae bacterium]
MCEAAGAALMAGDGSTLAAQAPRDGRLAEAGLEAKVALGLTGILYENLPVGLAGTMIIAAVLAGAMVGHVPAGWLLVWLIAMLAVTFGRLMLWHLQAACVTEQQADPWQRRFETGAFASGVVWGAAPLLIFPIDSFAHQIFMGFVLASMAAGAVSTLGSHVRSFALYLIPGLVPYCGRLVFEGGGLQIGMAAVFAFGQIVLLLSAKRLQSVTVNALRLKFENAQLVEALKSALAAAEEASRAKSLFLAKMSHEIRTPMNGVLGMTELLAGTRLDSRQQSLLGTVARSARTLLVLINDILDFSKIEANRLVIVSKPLDPEALVEDAVEALALEARQKSIDLALSVAPEVPPQILADAARLHQICINLLSNAIKFTTSGGVAVRISVEAGPEDGARKLVLVVRDTGCGIPADIQKRLFTPFEQARSAGADFREVGGTGLGLAISRQLAELMGGSIDLQSAPGEGTVATVRLPLRLVGTPAQPAPSRTGTGPGRALVVAGESFLGARLVEQLVDLGYETEAVASEQEAVGLLEAAAGTARSFAAAICVEPAGIAPIAGLAARVPDVEAWPGLVVISVVPWGREEASNEQPGAMRRVAAPLTRRKLAAALSSAPVAPPAGLPMSVRAKAHSPGALSQSLAGRSVLVVEDNRVNIEVMLGFLEALCPTLRVTVAYDGHEALAEFHRRPFDLVLMDCQMPGMDGLAVARRIRQLEAETSAPRTPLVAVTANAFAENRVACLDAGFDDVLSKPYSLAELAGASARHLRIEPGLLTHAAAPAVLPPSEGAGAAAATTAAPIDLDALGHFRDAYPGLFASLIGTYLDYLPEQIAALVVAGRDLDRSRLSGIAHNLKSSSGNVGATRLAGLCRTLEGDAAEAEASALRTLVVDIGDEAERVTVELQRIRASYAQTSKPACAGQAA